MTTLPTFDSKTSSPVNSSTNDWTTVFKDIYDEAVRNYEPGLRGPDNVVPSHGVEFLAAIGMTDQELYDFVEDGVEYGEPPLDTVLRISEVRRDYFLTVQKGQPSRKVISMNALPSGHEKLGRYPWLPRIIAKANAKLRGEMPADLMYGCGGDRPFLRRVGIDPANFLRMVWETGDNPEQILNKVKTHDPKR